MKHMKNSKNKISTQDTNPKKKNYTFYLTCEFVELLSSLAIKDDRSLNSTVERLIKNAVQTS